MAQIVINDELASNQA